MSVFDIDLTNVGLADGTHLAKVTKVEYQQLVGDKWNQDGTKNVTADELKAVPADVARLHLTLTVEGKGNVWHDLYFKESALGFMKQFCQAAGVALKNPDFDQLLGKQVMITLVTKSDPTYGDRQNISKVAKA